MKKELENLNVYMEDLILSDEHIKVQCNHTCFVRHSKVVKQELKEVLKLHAEVVTLCRTNKIKVSYKNKSKMYINELIKSGEYNKAYTDYEKCYNNLLIGWSDLLDKGYYDTYKDSETYTNELRPLNFAIQKMFFNNSPISKVAEIVIRLHELKEQITSYPEEFISITI